MLICWLINDMTRKNKKKLTMLFLITKGIQKNVVVKKMKLSDEEKIYTTRIQI